MSLELSRRALLRTGSVTGLASVAGCLTIGSGDTDGSGDRSLGFEVVNDITAQDFEDTVIPEDAPIEIDADPIEQQPAVISLRVERVVSGGTNEEFYQKRVQVPTDSTKTLRDQFTLPTEETLYALQIRLEPIVEDPSNTTDLVDREAGTTFYADAVTIPSNNLIRVRVVDSDDSNWLVPKLTLETSLAPTE